MYENADFKKGLKIMVEGSPYAILDFQHVKPGKGNQFTRTKMRNLLTGQLLERTFKSGERFEVPDVMNKEMSFLYKDDTGYTFMDKESYEQVIMTENQLGEAKNFLTENLDVVILFYNERPVTVDVPKAVNLKVAQTDPGMKGDTVSGATKPATMESGLVVRVPLHINEGDVLRIDTSTGEYVERVNK
ncbi:MAG: elongation factor P 2 [Oligoflexia bacterium]|nr:MAG: elongation factor P 2 [Oligoflexia bacterium]